MCVCVCVCARARARCGRVATRPRRSLGRCGLVCGPAAEFRFRSSGPHFPCPFGAAPAAGARALFSASRCENTAPPKAVLLRIMVLFFFLYFPRLESSWLVLGEVRRDVLIYPPHTHNPNPMFVRFESFFGGIRFLFLAWCTVLFALGHGVAHYFGCRGARARARAHTHTHTHGSCCAPMSRRRWSSSPILRTGAIPRRFMAEGTSGQPG